MLVLVSSLFIFYILFLSKGGIRVRLSFKLKKILCCILLSLILAFSNVLAVFNNTNYLINNQENQIFAARDYYYGFMDIEPIPLGSNVELNARICYTYRYYPEENKIFSSIDEIVTKLGGKDCCLYEWRQDYCEPYTYILGSDGHTARIRLFGRLENEITGDTERIVKELSITI